MHMNSIYQNAVSGSISAMSTFVAFFYGDINVLVVTVLSFIVIDYITGILVAISEHKLNSAIGFKGIAKKCWILIMIGVGNLLDNALNLNGVMKTLVCTFYIANEGISILENGCKLGIPIPNKIVKVLKTLKEKADKLDEDENEDETKVTEDNKEADEDAI